MVCFQILAQRIKMAATVPWLEAPNTEILAAAPHNVQLPYLQQEEKIN